jgi:hypothetical protein
MTSFRRRMTEDMQVRNLALNTQMSYVLQVSLFARHFNKSPELLGPEDIRAYQVYLTNEKKLAPGSVLIAVSALRFLYKICLKRDWQVDDVIPAPKMRTTSFLRSSDESKCGFTSQMTWSPPHSLASYYPQFVTNSIRGYALVHARLQINPYSR